MDKGKRGRARGIVSSNQSKPPSGRGSGSIEGGSTSRGTVAPAQPVWAQAGTSTTSTGASTITAARALLSGPRPSAPSVSTVGRGTSHRVEEVAPDSKARADIGNGGNGSRGALRGKRVINEIIITKPKQCTSKKGTIGQEVVLQSNYFRTIKKHDWSLYQYRVDFSPDIEHLRVRKGIIYSHRERFGGNIFDGTVLFCCKMLDEKDLEIATKNNNGDIIKVTLKYVGVLEPTDYQTLQILNLILRKSMDGLKLQLVGRNFFDAMAKVDIREYKLELWPGYKTSFRQHEKDILLCSEIIYKVMRTDTLYNILQKKIQEERNFQDVFKKEVIGMVVLTDYNNKTYRVDDVDFKASPNSTFETKNGQITYVEYYKKRYNVNIRDPKQPLLISKSTEKKLRGGENEFIMLVPELCRATGLSDPMRSNFQLMRAVSNHTRLTPVSRIDRLKAFNERLYNTRESMEVLNTWKLSLDKHLVELPGRILQSEDIFFGNNARVKTGPEADWTREFRGNSMFVCAILKRWYVIVPTRSQREASDFVRAIIKVAAGMKMQISDPRTITLNDDRNSTYVNAIENCCRSDPQLICLVVPNDNAERYSCIKKKLCVDRAVPSQVIVHKTIAPKQGKPSGLMSVATKVAIQMNCKLMGAPWTIHIPCKGLMTVGFDVCHSTRDKAKSYGAMVATMDLKVSTKFFSTVSEHVKGAELSNEISTNMTKALREYREVHGTLPDRILFYRDGVGEGALNQVFEHEVKYLKESLDKIYQTANIPNGCRFCFIVVSKRISTRYFLNKANPPPGTVVDDIITLPERYDFYLVSQSVRQGTVSPTSYNILYDSIGLDANQLQVLTYKYTHLYYNWSGTTRVPAVCQYAHKLAFLVGQYIHQSPSSILEKQLYFL
ncbi:protein aubergine-like [Condylostylus longicornis]|uniref:protein aubergine-like n=1 Tax=Condylostylus longicornis TaxID=2530218 RepID=UPI00244DB292|nr:protein aubergine-like [Condylostylus longicornis]